MKILGITPELVVENVEKTIDFYENILGFLLLDKVGSDRVVWAKVGWPGSNVQLMFIDRTSIEDEVAVLKDEAIGGSAIQLIEIEGINELYLKIKDEAVIVMELHTTDYGTREFAMKDPNGYVLMFSEKLHI